MWTPRRIAVVALILVALGVFAWSVAIEPDRLVIERVEVLLPEWPPALDGLVVAAISDVHTGSLHVDAAKLQQVVRLTNDQRPDLVVLLGDYVIHGVAGGHFVAPEETARVLAGLRSSRGVLAVLGNHDWWFDGERVRRALVSAGIPVLENDAVRIDAAGQPLWVVGLADMWTRQVDWTTPLRRVPKGDPVLALTHNPDVFPALPRQVTLTLAGHTHGGQVRLPLLGRPVVPSRYSQRYAAGLVVEEGRRIFITPGIGTSIVPVRLGVPPTVSVLTLRSIGVASPSRSSADAPSR